MSLMGAAAGAVAAWGVAHWFGSLLYGFGGLDALSLGAAALSDWWRWRRAWRRRGARLGWIR